MAVSINSNADKYTRTISLGLQSAWTVCCWVKLATDRGGVSQVPWQIDDGLGTSFFRLNFHDGSAGTFQMGGGTWFGLFGLTAAMNTWYFIGISGTFTSGAQEVRTVHRADGSTTWGGVQAPQSSTVLSATTLRIGGANTTNQYIDGSMCSVKMWNAPLSREEMMAESWTIVPKRTADLRAWYPWIRAEASDFSGNGWTLSAGTATTDTSPGPALPWGPGRRRIVVVPPPQLVEGSVDGMLPPLGGELAGHVTAAGPVGAELPALGGDFSGAATVSGQAASVLPALGAQLEGSAGAPGWLTVRLPALQGAFTGQGVGGAVAAGLPALSGSLDGQVTAHGSLAGTLPALAGALAAEVEIPPHDITAIPGPPQRRWHARGPATSWAATAPRRRWAARQPVT